MSSGQLAEEMLLKFDIKTSKSVICRTLKSRDDIMSLKKKKVATLRKKRKHMLSKERCDFEKRLDSRLRKTFLKRKKLEKNLKNFQAIFNLLRKIFNLVRNVNSDTAKIETERIIRAHPEYETDLKKFGIKFGKTYFSNFFSEIWLALEFL